MAPRFLDVIASDASLIILQHCEDDFRSLRLVHRVTTTRVDEHITEIACRTEESVTFALERLPSLKRIEFIDLPARIFTQWLHDAMHARVTEVVYINRDRANEFDSDDEESVLHLGTIPPSVTTLLIETRPSRFAMDPSPTLENLFMYVHRDCAWETSREYFAGFVKLAKLVVNNGPDGGFDETFDLRGTSLKSIHIDAETATFLFPETIEDVVSFYGQFTGETFSPNASMRVLTAHDFGGPSVGLPRMPGMWRRMETIGFELDETSDFMPPAGSVIVRDADVPKMTLCLVLSSEGDEKENVRKLAPIGHFVGTILVFYGDMGKNYDFDEPHNPLATYFQSREAFVASLHAVCPGARVEFTGIEWLQGHELFIDANKPAK